MAIGMYLTAELGRGGGRYRYRGGGGVGRREGFCG